MSVPAGVLSSKYVVEVVCVVAGYYSHNEPSCTNDNDQLLNNLACSQTKCCGL